MRRRTWGNTFAEWAAPSRERILTWGCGLLAVMGALLTTPATHAAAPTLDSIAAIRHVAPHPGTAPIAVHVRAVVTYYDTVAPNLFVQDRSGGIWVDLRGNKLTPPRPGQLLDLDGTVGSGFAPYIADPRWKVLGKAPLPAPITLTYAEASTGHYDGQWVEMDGVVRSFVQEAEGDVLVMDVATGTGSFKVRVPGYRAAFPMYLVDANVRFRGVCGSSFNSREQLVSIHLMTPSMDELKILKPAPTDPFSIPASPINSIRRFSADASDVHRVKVVGIVTARFPGRGLFLADSTGGVYVESQDGTPVEPGDGVEVIGFPAAGPYSPILLSARIAPTHIHVAQVPVQLTARQALHGTFDAQLVSIQGTVHGQYDQQGTQILALRSTHGIPFEASLGHVQSGKFQIVPDSVVRLTGICSVKADENGNPSEFRIILRSPADVQVIATPPWLTSRRALPLLAALAILTLAIIVWVVLLRRRVARQTRIIQDRLKAEAALEERYRRVFERNIAGLYIADADGLVIDCNEACAHMMGFPSRDALLEKRERVRGVIRQFWESQSAADPISNSEHRFQRHDGAWAWALANARQVADGHIEGAVLDITDRKLANEQIKFLAYYDSLTGLPNRALLQDRLSKSLAAARRSHEKVAVLFLDLDRFKNINDSLGHSHGDYLLQKVARRLELCAREEDTVARLGGDEFVIVLNSIACSADAAHIAERICHEVATSFDVLGQSLNVTGSIGISLSPEHGNNAETLIKNADAAMYRAKEEGRNTYRFFSQELTTQATERLILESSLRSALEEKQFSLRFQPELNLATGAIICCEALLRWNHPALGAVSPDRFIPIAESTGMIVQIGEWVLRAACREARKWQQESQVAVPIAVNVSAVQLNHPGFCASIESILEETGLDPKYLEMELTESVLLAHQDLTYRVFRDLEALGISITIDDFGTGYSSLSYLKQFPVRKLKIDRSFIRDIDTDADNAAITAAVIHMAKCLQIEAVAEGVETQAQLSRLRAMACDHVQGFLLGEPMIGELIPYRVRESSVSAVAEASQQASLPFSAVAAPGRRAADERLEPPMTTVPETA